MFINWKPKLHFDPNSVNLSATHGIPLPTYGNYGGPGYTAGTVGGKITGTSKDPPPVDDLDGLFYIHDLKYQNATSIEAQVAADVWLLTNMAALMDDPKYTNNLEARLYEEFATLGIAGNDLVNRLKYLTPDQIKVIAGAIPSALRNLEAGLADLPSEAKSLHGALNVFEQRYLPSLNALLGSALGSSELDLVTGQQDVATDTSKLVQAMASFGASGPALDTSMVTGSHNEPGQQAVLAVNGHHGSLDLGDIAFGNGEKKGTSVDVTSVNWSGYAVESPQGPFTDVKGSWIVPSVSSNPNQNAYSVTWIGIDGYNSKTVEQIGTEQDFNDKEVYSAWYEMYPKSPVYLNPSLYPVGAGDSMSAEVKYVGGKTYEMTLNDLTRDWTYPTTLQGSKPTIRSSAEWIVEGTRQLPLADFSKVTFTGASATAAVGPGGTEYTGTISDSNWQNDSITMVSTSGGVEAAPTKLSRHGSSFSINYAANSNNTGTFTVSDGAHAANQSGSNTTLIGGNGINVLDGSAGHDVLTGGNGNDLLIGGPGNTLMGRKGADVFLFRDGFGANTITDFNVSADSIQFDKSVFSLVSAIASHTVDSPKGAIISDGHGDQVTLTGITASQVVANPKAFIVA